MNSLQQMNKLQKVVVVGVFLTAVLTIFVGASGLFELSLLSDETYRFLDWFVTLLLPVALVLMLLVFRKQ